MNKIVYLEQIEQLLKNLRKDNKKVVLVGGCFDLFHYGHFQFLKQAKSFGDVLIVALEHDLAVKRLKGKNRPLIPQKARAEILAGFSFVDYVILLPDLQSDKDYQNLSIQIKPNIIAVTDGDKQLHNKQKFAKEVNGKLVIIPYTITPSTSQLINIFQTNL